MSMLNKSVDDTGDCNTQTKSVILAFYREKSESKKILIYPPEKITVTSILKDISVGVVSAPFPLYRYNRYLILIYEQEILI